MQHILVLLDICSNGKLLYKVVWPLIVAHREWFSGDEDETWQVIEGGTKEKEID